MLRFFSSADIGAIFIKFGLAPTTSITGPVMSNSPLAYHIHQLPFWQLNPTNDSQQPTFGRFYRYLSLVSHQL